MDDAGGVGQDYRRVEVTVVDLIAARAAEQLGAVHVDGDLVTARGCRRQVSRHVGEMWRRVAEHGGAGHAGVESRAGGVTARAAAGDFRWVASDGGASARRLDAEAVLDGAEWLGAIACAEVGEVATWMGEDLAVDFVVVVVIDLGRHGGGGGGKP